MDQFMAHFQLPNSKFFPGGTRLFVSGTSGVERLVVQIGKQVTLELAGLAGPAVTPTITQFPLASMSDWLGMIGRAAPAGPGVVTISAPSGSGIKRSFTVKADRPGLAAILAEDAPPLFVFAGDFKKHEDGGVPLERDLIADVFRAADPAKTHILTRMLFNNADNLFDEKWDGNQKYCPRPPCLPCGSVSKGRGSAIFHPVDYDYQDYFKRVPGMGTSAARSVVKREDVKYDETKLKRGCQAIASRLAKGMPSVVGLVYSLASAVRANGDIDVHGTGGHSVPIVGCNTAADKFLYIDVYPEGSTLKYTGGHAGKELFPDDCNYLGVFDLTTDAARGTLVLRARPGTAGPSGLFAGSQFLEVVSGPLTG